MPTGINLSSGIVVGSAKALDAKFGPYASTATALADIAPALRYKGLTVGVLDSSNNVVEYWFKSGILNSDFVVKVPELTELSKTTVYSETPPINPFAGMRWVDTTTLSVYERYSDTWVEILD